MAEIRAERLTADADEEFAVFLIGMRINMPPFGLARATRAVPAHGARESAASRLAAARGS